MAHATPCDSLSEAELVASALTRNEAAVRELIRRCNRQLFRIARSIMHNDSEAEDIVQAAYVSAFTKLETFRGESSFVTWISRITMNEAYGRLRRKGPIVQFADYQNLKRATEGFEEGALQTMSQSPTNPEAELGRAEVRAFLERAIDALPEPFRLTYVLRDIQEMTTREVAQLLQINVVTVKTRLFRARRLLRAEISKHFATDFYSIYPFDGARCVGMADRVINAMAGG
ncbi:MAG: RNA polymerase sigma factor [Rhodobacterales bacterium]|nr:RNA polymerase sigma factor [Rhodobacterales bacterium]